MALFTLFIFGAVVIGAGAMLSPAVPTGQPRIGLSAALALGLVMGGALFWAFTFGWDTLVVDYLLFALVTAIFLFGTLSYGQKRAEARGEELADRDQGWPSARDLLFFAFAALIFIVPTAVLPVPLDTDAQGFGYLALMARLGGGFTTLAPFQPDVTYLYAPGFSALTAYLNAQLGLGLHQIQIAVGAVLSIVLILLAYDFGAEWQDKRLGRACAVAMLIGIGLFTAFMDSHYTTLLGLTFALAFFTFALRWTKHGMAFDAVAAGLMLGAVVLAHPNTTIIVGLGFIPWLATLWLARPRITVRRWLILAIAVPLIGLVAISPWLLAIFPLLSGDIVSPFPRDADYWTVMIVYHGVIIVPIALVGLIVGLRRRDPVALLCLPWLILILDFAAFGVLESVLTGVIAPLTRYDYPFSIAWRGPVLPYMMLGGAGLLWLWDRLAEARFGRTLHRLAPALTIGGIVLTVGAGAISPQILQWTKGRIGFYGAFSSADDVAAMEWIKANTPADARLLNYPAPHEGDWVPVISEREAVYFRPQPFFRGMEVVEAEQARLTDFWIDPADPAWEAALRNAGVDYVIVPQIVSDPASIETMWRWREPFTLREPSRSQVADAAYLREVFNQNGARVFALDDVAAYNSGNGHR